MINCPDQLGRACYLKTPARRIVSLVPSITETLYDLGCREEVVGITKFCFQPNEWFRTKTRVGGTKTFHPEKIRALQPDLILANKEENDADLVQALMSDYSVWVSDVKNVADALELIEKLGILTAQKETSAALSKNISLAIRDMTPIHQSNRKVAYMIWQNPTMVAGGDTFIHHMLELNGWENCFADQNRYPTISRETLAKADPDVILLSSEPFPFKEKHILFFQEICPNAVIRLIDGTYFSWYGSRLLPAISYFANLKV